MKTVKSLLAAIFFFQINIAFPQWQIIPSGTISNLVDICFVTDSVGFIVGQNGVVLKTTDQGTSWNTSATLPGSYTSICNVGKDTIFVGGNNIYRSDNGGSTWNKITSLTNTLSDLHFFNSKNGVYLFPGSTSCSWGGNNYSLPNYAVNKTNNYGATWQPDFGGLDATSGFLTYNNVTYISGTQDGFCCLHCEPTHYLHGFKTTNGGASWVTGPTIGNINCIINDSTIYYIRYLSGNSWTGFKTLHKIKGSVITDLNWNWNSTQVIQQFVYINDIDGYILSGGNIYKSATNFIAWDVDYMSANSLNKMLNDGNKQLFAIGTNGTILKSKIIKSLYPDSIYRIKTDSNSLSFGSTMINQNRVKQITIRNAGNMDLNVSLSSKNMFKISLPDKIYATTISFSIHPTHDTIINVMFTPTDTMLQHDTLVISSTNQSDIKIPLTGKGIKDFIGEITSQVYICGDTVKIIGNITIKDGAKVTICPGTTLLFMGPFEFNVFGTLIAIGLPNDSIKFTPQNKVAGWNSINFYNTTATDSSILKFCIIEYGKKNAYSSKGGGLYFLYRSNVLINSCSISNNYSTGGGGIYFESSSPIIKNNKIFNNTSLNGGGGVYIGQGCSPVIFNNKIYNNKSNTSFGGGLLCFNNYYGNNTNYLTCIIQNLIFNNSSFADGGGICCIGSSPNIINNTICNNSANEGGGISCRGNTASNPTILNNIVYNNLTDQFYINTFGSPISQPVIQYCDIQGGYNGGVGIIDQNPEFVSPTDSIGVMLNIGNYDWSLKQNSLCIDAGNPITDSLIPQYDFAGNPRMYSGNNIDIGAYEYQGVYNSVKEFNNSLSVSIFPNPADDKLFVSINTARVENSVVSVYDNLGRIALTKTVTEPYFSIELKDLGKGIYFIKIANKTGATTNKKFVKN